MDINNNKTKKFGTREEVYKGLFGQTAGGLKKDDIIEKKFGTKTLYISKKISDKMKINFNIIKESNPNYFKRLSKKTLVSIPLQDEYKLTNTCSQSSNTNSHTNSHTNINVNVNSDNPSNNTNNSIHSKLNINENNKKKILDTNTNNHHNKNNYNIKAHKKTQKISFNINENKIKNVYYPELQGMNINELKNELIKEENEEDNLYNVSNENNCITNQTDKQSTQFSIEDMPEIDITNL